jgi:CRISPR type I-E-associated protein CasB/Cse2
MSETTGVTARPFPPWRSPASPLVDALNGRFAAGDRHASAVLRRQMRTPQAVDPAAVAIVYPLVGRDYRSQDAGLLAAGLWAVWHARYDRPVNADGVNIGAALRCLGDEPRAGRLFQGLTTATEPTLPLRLQHAVAALADASVALDWRRLHADIRTWMYGRQRQVISRWATGLYSPPPRDDLDKAGPPVTAPTTRVEQE